MIVSLQRPPTASASYSAFCIEEAPESCTPDKSALPLYLSLEAPESLPVARSVIVMKASDEPLRYISSVFVVKSGIAASDEPFASIFALSAIPDILHREAPFRVISMSLPR